MMVYDCFRWDPKFMQLIQHELYWGKISEIFVIARNLYQYAEFVIGEESQLGKDAKQVTGVNHKIFQTMHDIIAAQFRYEKFEILIQCQLPGVFYKISDHDYFTGLWLEFYSETVNKVFEREPSLIRHVLIAVTYPNPDPRGIASKDYIYMTLKDLFPVMSKNFWCGETSPVI